MVEGQIVGSSPDVKEKGVMMIMMTTTTMMMMMMMMMMIVVAFAELVSLSVSFSIY